MKINKLVATYQFMKLWQPVFFQACNFDWDQKRKKSSDNLKATSMLLSFFINYNQCNKYHCVKCARIRVFSYQYFPYKDKIYDSFLIRENTVRQNLISGIFYAVTIFSLNSKLADIILAYNYSTRRGKINYWRLLISANLLIAFEKSYYQIPDIYLSLSI